RSGVETASPDGQSRAFGHPLDPRNPGRGMTDSEPARAAAHDAPAAEPQTDESPGWTPAPLGHLGGRIWAVLGGGGLKGLAHVGAWQAIEEAGVRVSGIVGTSIGALIGALVAGGMRWKDLVPLAFALKKNDI